MFSGFEVGRNFEALSFEGELEGSTISINGTLSGTPLIVSEQCVLAIEAGNGGNSVGIYKSCLAHFESLRGVRLSKDYLLPFAPNFRDPELIDETETSVPCHRIVDVHSSGAVLFTTFVVQKISDEPLHIHDKGFFIQTDIFSEPIPLPVENVLGFTKDQADIVVCYIDEDSRSRLLTYIPQSRSFKNIVFSDEVTDFYGGALSARYLCGISVEGPDGSELPHLVNNQDRHMRPLPGIDSILGLSDSGVVIGHRYTECSPHRASYIHPFGIEGDFVSSSGLACLPQSIIDQGNAEFHIAVGALGDVGVISDPLGVKEMQATLRSGALWIGSCNEYRAGLPIAAEPISHRLPSGVDDVVNLDQITPDMRIVGTTIQGEQILLVPKD